MNVFFFMRPFLFLVYVCAVNQASYLYLIMR